MKGNLSIDPRGLIFEAYRIKGIRPEECRSIFLDWALGIALGQDMQAHIATLLAEYSTANPDHPMTAVLLEGQAQATGKGRRGGRKGRV